MPHSLKPRASADLDEIYVESVQEFGLAQADTYLAGLIASFDFIGSFPRVVHRAVAATLRLPL